MKEINIRITSWQDSSGYQWHGGRPPTSTGCRIQRKTARLSQPYSPALEWAQQNPHALNNYYYRKFKNEVFTFRQESGTKSVLYKILN